MYNNNDDKFDFACGAHKHACAIMKMFMVGD